MKEKNRAVTSVTIELHKNDNSLHLNSIDIKELNKYSCNECDFKGTYKGGVNK